MNLLEMEEGQKGIVSRIDGHDSLSCRLRIIGIAPGSEVEIMSKGFFNGPISVFIKGTKLGLGIEAARRVYI